MLYPVISVFDEHIYVFKLQKLCHTATCCLTCASSSDLLSIITSGLSGLILFRKWVSKLIDIILPFLRMVSIHFIRLLPDFDGFELFTSKFRDLCDTLCISCWLVVFLYEFSFSTWLQNVGQWFYINNVYVDVFQDIYCLRYIMGFERYIFLKLIILLFIKH